MAKRLTQSEHRAAVRRMHQDGTYERLLAEQGGVCGICGKPPKEGGRRLDMDHSHATLKPRGVLCHFCNRFVVGPRVTPELLLRAAEYLRRAA